MAVMARSCGGVAAIALWGAPVLANEFGYEVVRADAAEQRMESNVMRAVLAESDLFRAYRSRRHVHIALQQPHRVLSTSAFGGGERLNVMHLVNHQSMEASNDQARFEKILSLTDEQYHQEVANELSVPAEAMALMGTAANMNHIAHVRKSFRALTVDAFVTAGVKGNALRAGDAANWYEGDDGNEFVGHKGTINTIVMINQPVLSGAQAKAAMVMTEAKTAALMQLSVAAKHSSHLATGTGTDQFIIASLLTENVKPLESASGHLKLGELIGSAVQEATLEALRWQNDLERSATASITNALGRFGLSEPVLMASLKEQLPDSSFALLAENELSFLTEPRTVASAYAFAAILDRFQYGTLSPQLAPEVLKDAAANVAVAISMRPADWRRYWQAINVSTVSGNDVDKVTTVAIAAFVEALAIGWQAKWQP